ncbi:VOC family protein [Synechococcales cyanobacterium C]|uniref:VOC family protein n=1 Tax=Petrachloros mirabilis ULC683 TaxID=2781853 RepID=A0A8K2A965_9CYAN|nr:VOC family protein [Petrachloros mirabilis]NCJ07899.1 VOC family protein [Petrachloros mirabilis ULC683]
MTIELDHIIVPCRNQVRSAKRLAELLGVPWAEKSIGSFSPVYVNSGLTLDFQETDDNFPIYHVCFRVEEEEFNAILKRLKAFGIDYRSTLRGGVDKQVNTEFGGLMIYWNEPDDHQWEMLTVSYARQES